MSFNPNDKNPQLITLSNYEEFFILYMDNELSDAQMKMVDEFLAVHSHLQPEFDLLLSTRLPMEEFSMDKEELFSGNMKVNSICVELLLYIDNELEEGKKKELVRKIATSQDLQAQLAVLNHTPLDSS